MTESQKIAIALTAKAKESKSIDELLTTIKETSWYKYHEVALREQYLEDAIDTVVDILKDKVDWDNTI